VIIIAVITTHSHQTFNLTTQSVTGTYFIQNFSNFPSTVRFEVFMVVRMKHIVSGPEDEESMFFRNVGIYRQRQNPEVQHHLPDIFMLS
jgi:hypothetical protein